MVRYSGDGGYSPRTDAHAYGTGGRKMPMKSEKQRRAMHAAARGKSNIGIPKSVGKSFVSKDMPKTGRRNGLMPSRMK